MLMLDACERLLLLVTVSTSGGCIMLVLVLMLLGGPFPFLFQIICAWGWLMVDSVDDSFLCL